MSFGRGLAICLTAVLGLSQAADAAESRGLTIQLRAGEAKDAPTAEEVRLYGASHALVIGIDNYSGGWPRLSNAIKDARQIAAELEKKGFETTVRSDLDSVELERTLREFFVVKGADPEARLFVWFAGHGHTQNGEGFLVPRDAARPTDGANFLLSALPMRRFGEYVRLARSKHVFAVFDSCFSGTVFDTQRSIPPVAITRATTLPVRQFLTSGDADQAVSDDGTFRELFIRALRGEERADANGDGFVTASELGLFLTDRLTNLTQSRQTPRYGKLRDKDYDRGDFVFALAGPEAPRPVAAPPQSAAAEVVYWQSIKDSASPSDFEAYLEQFPNGTFTGLARSRLASLGGAQAAFRVDAMSEEFVVVKGAIMRAAPSTAAATVAQLRAGTLVKATGKVRDRDWYRVEHEGFGRGYLSASLVDSVWFKVVAPSYDGEISTAIRQRPDRVTTKLEYRAGTLRGSYTIQEPGGASTGGLSDFEVTGKRSGTFRWKDNYGGGTLSVEFADDLGSFHGTWVPDGMPNAGGKWSGRK